MKITKFGHCCLLIEDQGKRILTDPGSYTADQNTLTNLDLVLITHEHVDHLHLDSMVEIMKNNPTAKIVCNTAVAKILSSNGWQAVVLEGMTSIDLDGVSLEAHDAKHAEIFEEYGQVQNTGYLINHKLFYPGDALHNPNCEIEVLAFPTAGGWANIKESINYVFDLKPKKCFPVHDGAFRSTPFFYDVYKTYIPAKGIELILPEKGKGFEL